MAMIRVADFAAEGYCKRTISALPAGTVTIAEFSMIGKFVVVVAVQLPFVLIGLPPKVKPVVALRDDAVIRREVARKIVPGR